MKKIIAIAVLAVGVLAWRMGAMQSNAPALRVRTSEGKIYTISSEKARLFQTINEALMDSSEGVEVPLLNVAGPVFERIEHDLAWVIQTVHGVTDLNNASAIEGITKLTWEERKALAENAVSALSVVQYSQKDLEEKIENLKAANYLQMPELIERYAKEIAGMLTSDAVLRLLAQQDIGLLRLIADQSINGDFKREIYAYIMPHEIWVERRVIRHNNIVISAVFSPDGNKVVPASYDGTAKIYAWNGTAWIEQYVIRHNDIVKSAVFSPDGNKVVTASGDGTAKVYVWNGAAWIEQGVISHNGWVHSAVFSPDGSRVVMASYNTAKIYAWNGTAWIEQGVIRHNHAVKSVVFSPDGNKVVTASHDNTAKIYAWNGTAWIEQGVIGHNNYVKSAVFSPDGNKVVTASWDHTAKIYAWNGTAWVEQGVIAHARRVTSALFSPDGSKVVTASEDGTAQIWHLIFWKNFDQALLLQLLKWEKAQGLPPSWVFGWGRGVMDTFSAADKAVIKTNFPKTMLQKVKSHFGSSSHQ